MSESLSAAPDAPEPRDDGEAALWDEFKNNGSVTARERLFMRHVAFARNIARRHHRETTWGDLELSDLRQLAYAGLLEALDRFDPGRGVPFRPFAAHRISGSVRDGIAQMSEARRQSTRRHEAWRERTRSLAEAADAELPIPDAMEKLAEIAVGLALGFILEDAGLTVHNDVEQGNLRSTATAYDSLVWRDMVSQLRLEIMNLPERERMILRAHYEDDVGFEHLASLLHLSKGRISQLHRAALTLLRQRMDRRGHFRLER